MPDSNLTTKHTVIEVRNVPLRHKLDAIGAAIAVVREAHRDVISTRAWAALNVAQEKIYEAMIHANENHDDSRYLQGTGEAPLPSGISP